MKRVIKQEETRIGKEETLKEKIKQNAGKRLDFFQVPSAGRRVDYKNSSRSVSSMSAKTSKKSQTPRRLTPKGF